MFTRDSIQNSNSQHEALAKSPNSEIFDPTGNNNAELGIILTKCRLSWTSRYQLNMPSAEDEPNLDLDSPMITGTISGTDIPKIVAFDNFERPVWISLIHAFDPNIRSVGPFPTSVGLIYRIGENNEKIVTAVHLNGQNFDAGDHDSRPLEITTAEQAAALFGPISNDL